MGSYVFRIDNDSIKSVKDFIAVNRDGYKLFTQIASGASADFGAYINEKTSVFIMITSDTNADAMRKLLYGIDNNFECIWLSMGEAYIKIK
jgi:hypothetical protein